MSASASASPSILVVGSINADVFIDIDRLPLPGETISANRPDTGTVLPGGKGANQAVACARLQPTREQTPIKTYWCGQYGNDTHATMLKRVLKEYGVDDSLAATADVPSGQAYILLQKGGQNSIILVGAANQSWPTTLPSSLQTALSNASAIMLQREIPEAINIAVAAIAHQHSVPVYLDMGGEDSPISSQLLQHLTFLTANETELARVAKLPTDTDEQVHTAIKHVRQTYGIPNILITLGSRGSILVTPEVTLAEPAWKVEKIVDTTGAGDCFRAAFAVAALEKRPWSSCLKFASAAAAICIQVKGAMPSMPSRQQVEQLLGQA